MLTPFALEFWIVTGVALFCGAKDWRDDHPTQWITINSPAGSFGRLSSALTEPNQWYLEEAKDADVAVHGTFPTAEAWAKISGQSE